MAQEKRDARSSSQRLSLPGGKLPLRPGKHSWRRNRRSWQTQKADFEEGKKSLLNNGDKNFVNAKEKMYDHFPLTVHQMDIIIGVLFALIALFLVLGVTHTSFFGLFGG